MQRVRAPFAAVVQVSRAGMIYLNVEDLGWRPFITSWLAAKSCERRGCSCCPSP